MYSWIWLFLRPSAGSLIGITIFEPSHTTVDIERRVLGRDLVVVEVLQLAEAHAPRRRTAPSRRAVPARRCRRRDRCASGRRADRPSGWAGCRRGSRARAARCGSGCGRRTCAPCRRTRATWPSRSSPCSSCSDHGSRMGRAPRDTAAANAASASFTSHARSCTPSPWRRTCSAIGDSALSAPDTTRRMSPCSST